MILKKKQIVTATLVLALGAAVFVNWYLTKPETQTTVDSITTTHAQQSTNLGDAQYVSATTAKASNETMSDFKVKRDSAHDQAKENLNDVIKDSESAPEAVAKASETLSRLTADIKNEADLENLITAKIGSECVVIFDEDSCQVIVGKNVLTDNISIQIKELVLSKTELTSKEITIIELNKV